MSGQAEPVSAATSGNLDKSVSREAGTGTGPASHEETFSDTSLPQGENGVNTSIRENASGMQTGVSYAGNDLNRQNSHGILNIKDGGQNGRAQTVDGQAEAGGSAGISGSVIAGIDKGLETGLPPYNGRGDYRSSRIPLSEEVQENLRTKGITPLQLSPAQSAEQFYRDIGRAKQSNPYGAFVEQHSADEYAGMQLFTGENGQVGAAVTGDGNIVSVYKNGDCHSRGAVSSLLLTALQNGGVKLDNFHGKLSQFYLQHGFIPVARTRFVDEFAPTDWNYKRDGRPDIIFWVHNGDTVEQVASRIGTYELLTAWDHVPLFDSYEAAAAYRDAVLRERHAAETGEALRSDSSAFGVNPDTDASEIQNDAKRGFAQGESDTRASIGQGDILREWAERLQRYGPVRPEVEADRQVPAQIDENTRVSRGIGTAMGYSPLVTDEAVPAIQEAVLSGRGTYTAVSDAEALRQARAIIRTKGAESARRSFEEKLIADRRITKTDIAVAELLVQEALSRGEYDTAAQLLGDASVAASQAGQTAQAVALLRKLTPEGRLQTLQRNLDKMNDQFLYRENRATKHAQEILENKEQIANLEDQVHEGTLDRDSAMQRITQLQKEIARLGGGLELSQLQKELILSQTDNAGMEQAVQQVSQQIAQAVPVTGVEKYNAWRFFSMLANPTTHIRNMLGNTSMGLTVMAKDIAAATMEAAADTVAKVVGKDGITRTKSLRAFSPRERARYHDLVEQQYLRLREDLQGDKKAGYLNKFLDDRKIFGDTKLEDVRKFAMDLLEREDGLFLKAHYREAMYQYLTANRVDPNTVSEAQLQRANDYAIQEAQKATFRDASALASWLNRVSRKNKAAEIVIEGNLPFKKTPINILKRGVEYSPLGLVNTVKNAVNMARGKEGYNAARFIDSLASTFTGSALTAIGAWLASQGILTGLLGDDKEDDFKRLQGQQSYALNIGDTSYTIDWLSPDAMPLFVGVEIWNALQEKDEGLTFADATEALSHMLEPMTQMSMLQGLSGTLDSISNSDNKLTAFLSESLTSYLLQMLPTLGGKIGNIIDDTRRQAYIDKNSPLPSDMQYALQQTMKKIPGASTALQPYINEWGEEETEESVLTRILESLISPGYASELDSSEMEQELQRLYDATGETGVLPGRPQKYFTVSGQRVDLTGDAYTQLAKVRGSTQKDILTQLVESDLYLAMDDENRVKAVQRVYDYAAEVAKAEVAEVELSEFAKNAKNAKQKYGLSTAEYILFTQQKSGKKQPEVVKIIDGLPISSKDKDRLYTDIYAESTLDKNSIW